MRTYRGEKERSKGVVSRLQTEQSWDHVNKINECRKTVPVLVAEEMSPYM